MKVGPLFKWFGSKWQSAKHYPAPEHRTIFEPYAGGAGYSLNYVDHAVVLQEADPNLIELWTWLIGEATETNIRAIPVNLKKGQDIRELGMSRGQSLLVKHWQRTNSVGECWTVSSWCDSPGLWSANTRARVAEQVSAVRHWQVLGVHRHDVTYPFTAFVDPPYEYNYQYRSDLPAVDYQALAKLCRYWKTEAGCQVIVCEAMGKNGERPKWLPFRENHRSVTSRRKETQSHHSNELIWFGDT